jgi:hypothetical protein
MEQPDRVNCIRCGAWEKNRCSRKNSLLPVLPFVCVGAMLAWAMWLLPDDGKRGSPLTAPPPHPRLFLEMPRSLSALFPVFFYFVPASAELLTFDSFCVCREASIGPWLPVFVPSALPGDLGCFDSWLPRQNTPCWFGPILDYPTSLPSLPSPSQAAPLGGSGQRGSGAEFPRNIWSMLVPR